jgi:hypothetical protein
MFILYWQNFLKKQSGRKSRKSNVKVGRELLKIQLGRKMNY